MGGWTGWEVEILASYLGLFIFFILEEGTPEKGSGGRLSGRGDGRRLDRVVKGEETAVHHQRGRGVEVFIHAALTLSISPIFPDAILPISNETINKTVFF